MTFLKTSGHGSGDDRDLSEVRITVDVEHNLEQIDEAIMSSVKTWSGHGPNGPSPDANMTETYPHRDFDPDIPSSEQHLQFLAPSQGESSEQP
ncbi:hypothetical protein LIER_28242 [Lithospermum erythrorhizon]|uniref:Uncharacterized protein n=1 Tax=Lithospermum erythrorhizon TaxID=34254 RepID=A0AAV3RL15_LITER